jgi:hypothetical protein
VAVVTSAAEGFRRHEVVEPGKSHHVAQLRAAGMRVQPATNAQALRVLAVARREWQSLAWKYRDLIPELRFATGYRSGAISRVRLYAAQIDGDDDKPVPLSLIDDPDKAHQVTVDHDLARAAIDNLNRLPIDDGFSFLGIWSENFDIAGDCWLHGFTDPDTGEETWRIRSIDGVKVSPDGRTVKVQSDVNPGTDRDVDWKTEELFRLWVQHPREGYLADSPCQATLDTFENIVLFGRELRAVSRSRSATNGILAIPNTMTLMRNIREDGDDGVTAAQSNNFMADLTAVLLAPITNEGDAGAVAPAVLTGSEEDIKAIRHITFERESSADLGGKVDRELTRMARGLDLPPEVVSGVGDANHWSAWQIDASTFRYHIEPSVRRMVDSLTVAFLRTTLIDMGYDPAEVRKIRVWYDAANITENTNRRQDAIDAFDRGGIGWDAFREALGFSDTDKPEEHEMLLMALFKIGLDPITAGQLIQRLLVPGETPVIPERETITEKPGTPGAPALPAGSTSTPPALSPGTPKEGGSAPAPPTGVSADGGLHELYQRFALMAAATVDGDEEYRLTFAEMRDMVEIERTLRDRLVTAADAALQQAVAKASSRLRAKLSGDNQLIGQLRQCGPHQFGQVIGRDRALTAGATTDFLLAGAFAGLQVKFTKWTLAAVDAIVSKLATMLGLRSGTREHRDLTERVRRTMAARVDDGWDRLEGTLHDLADKVLYGEHKPSPSDLADTTVQPGTIRAVLADIGGTQPGTHVNTNGKATSNATGLANGHTVQQELDTAGAVELGHLWVYGVTLAPDQFEPHRHIEGIRFANWSDAQLNPPPGYEWLGDHMHPGDHHGCMCDTVPAYAVPRYSQTVREALATPGTDMTNIIRLADLDDAAGRNGTTAQTLRDRHDHIQRLQQRFISGKVTA